MGLSLKEKLNYHVLPPLILVIFTSIVQVIVRIGNPAQGIQLENILGNAFAWKLISCVLGWALLWLRVPGKTFHGPPTNFGYVPVYKVSQTEGHFSY